MEIPGTPTARTRVLFISSAEDPGADTFIHMLIMRNLDRARFDVHAACSAGNATVLNPGYQALAAIPDLHLRPTNFGPSLSGLSTPEKLVHLPQLLAGVGGLASLVGYIRKHRIAVVHSTDRPRDTVACAILGKVTGAKSVIHAHLKCADWMGRSMRWAMGQVDGLIGVSRFVAKSLVDNGYDSAKTYAVLNAIDLPRWNDQLDGSGLRRDLNIPTGAPVISCAGRLFPGKGQHIVVRAVAKVVTEFPDVRLLIVGRDDLQVVRESFTEELKRMAVELGIEQNVFFLGQRSDMPLVVAASDVFALPSDEEPFGLVFAEAMAMRKPVLAVANGGTPEVVEDGRNGFLSPPEDAEALAANLRTLLRDADLRKRMGDHGRRQVEARFTAARLAEDTARVYDALLSKTEAIDSPYAAPVRRSSSNR